MSIMEEAKGLKDLECADVKHFVSVILGGGEQRWASYVSPQTHNTNPLKQDKLRRTKLNLKVPTGLRSM